MKRKVTVSALALLGALAVACGDDSDDGNGGGNNNEDAGVGNTDSGQQTGGTKAWAATLVTITADNPNTPVQTSHKISLLNADDATPLDPPVETTSEQGTGKINLDIPLDKLVDIYVEGQGAAGAGTSTYDTYIANVNVNSGDVLLRISSAGTLAAAAGTAQFTANQERAAVTGAVYWSPGGGPRKGQVGCAKLFIDGKPADDNDYDARYMGSASPLPVPFAMQSQTSRRGQFYIANMTTGTHKLQVSMDDGATFIAEQDVFVPVTRAEAKSPTKSVIVQVGIDVDVAANPTPEGNAACPPLM